MEVANRRRDMTTRASNAYIAGYEPHYAHVALEAGYEFLEVGQDVLITKDEVYYSTGDRWLPIDKAYLGHTIQLHWQPCRRPIKQAAVVAKDVSKWSCGHKRVSGAYCIVCAAFNRHVAD